jgi:hypothetical protein
MTGLCCYIIIQVNFFFLKLCNVACVVDSGIMLDISQL